MPFQRLAASLVVARRSLAAEADSQTRYLHLPAEKWVRPDCSIAVAVVVVVMAAQRTLA